MFGYLMRALWEATNNDIDEDGSNIEMNSFIVYVEDRGIVAEVLDYYIWWLQNNH